MLRVPRADPADPVALDQHFAEIGMLAGAVEDPDVGVENVGHAFVLPLSGVLCPGLPRV